MASLSLSAGMTVADMLCCSCNVFVDPIMRLWFMLGPVFAVVRCVLSSLPIIKIKRNDWLLADTCPQAANHCALF